MAGKYILLRKRYEVETTDQINNAIYLYFLYTDSDIDYGNYFDVHVNDLSSLTRKTVEKLCDVLKISDATAIHDFLNYGWTDSFFKSKPICDAFFLNTLRNTTLGVDVSTKNNYIYYSRLQKPYLLVGESTTLSQIGNLDIAPVTINFKADKINHVTVNTSSITFEGVEINGFEYDSDYEDNIRPYTHFFNTLFVGKLSDIKFLSNSPIPLESMYNVLYATSPLNTIYICLNESYDLENIYSEVSSEYESITVKTINGSLAIPQESIFGYYGWQNRVSDSMITNLTQEELRAMGFSGTVPPYNPTPGPSTGGGGGEWNPLPAPTIPVLPEINPDYGSTDPAPTVPDASDPNVNTGVGPYGSGATPDNVTPGQQLPGDAKPTVPLAGQHGGQRLMVESYAMDGTMMQVLRDTLWRRDTLAKLKDIFEAPEDLILNIHRLPFNCSIYTNPPEKIDLTWILPDSVYNVTGRPINSPLVTWKYGEVKIPRYYNTYLDFSPYSSAKMYIPFVGFVQLDSKEVVGHTVSLGYSCDLISGDGTATLSSDGIGIIGTYATNFAMQIPITSRNFNDVAVGAIEKFASLAMTAVSGSFATGNALPMIPQSTGGMFNMSQPGVNALQTQSLLANSAPAPALPPAGNLTSNVEQQSMAAMYNMPISDSSPSQAVSGITLPTVHPSQLLASAMQAFRVPEQPANRQSGGLGGNTGWTSPLTPYIYITYNTPNWSTNHTNLFGLSSNIVAAIGTFKGYTEFGSIQLNAGGIMLDEQEELKRLLTGGVVI